MFVYFLAIWYLLWPYGIFYGNLVYIFYGHMVCFPRFGTFLPVLVCCTNKNLATLLDSHKQQSV
jgi:hypothetical protein